MKKLYRYKRTTISTGDVFGTASPVFFSRIIRLFTKSKVSHVGLFIWIKNRLFCVEMLEGKGCILTPASNRLTGKFTLGKYKSKYKEEEIIGNAINDVGRLQYSLVGAILAPFIDTPSSDNICSEWVSKVIGMEFPQVTRGILPIDIMNKCETSTIYMN